MQWLQYHQDVTLAWPAPVPSKWVGRRWRYRPSSLDSPMVLSKVNAIQAIYNLSLLA